MKKINLKLGEFYLTRDGKVVEIIEIREITQTMRGRYLYLGHTSTRWTWLRNGCYLPSEKTYYRDLVKKITIETHPEYFI